MTSYLRQKLPPSLRIHYNPIILLDTEIYIAPDISTLFEPRGPDFTAEERTRDRTVIRQRLSSQYSFSQDSTIYIPWWRKKPGQCMVGVREKTGDTVWTK
jgi:hypothetical protein